MKQVIIVSIVFIKSFFGFYIMEAQVPFAQVGQIPLLLNPSLAGSKDKKRIAAGFSNYNPISKKKYEEGAMNTSPYSWKFTNSKDFDNTDYFKNTNLYLSYDQMVKKIGSGVGVYFLHQAFKRDSIDNLWSQSVASEVKNNFLFSTSENTYGITIAPKYGINKSDSKKINYTFSPSLCLEYSHVNQLHHYFRQAYGVELGAYVRPIGDSLQFNAVNISANIFRAGAGLAFNSESLVILYKASSEIESAEEKAKIISVSHSGWGRSERGINLQQRIYSVVQSLTIGKSFTTRNKNFSCTPIVGIGLRSYLNVRDLDSPKNEDIYYYSTNLDNKMSGINYSHASLNFRAKKILFGGAYTYSTFREFYGGTLGFQNSHMKVMTNWSFSSSYLSSELTVNIFI